MKSLMKNFRTVGLTLAATILVVPQAVLAGAGGQPHFGGGKSGPSGGNGSFGMGKGPSDQFSQPVRSINSGAPATINSSSGPVLAHTASNLATSTVLDKSISTSSKQTTIAASASNLNGSGESNGISAIGNLNKAPASVSGTSIRRANRSGTSKKRIRPLAILQRPVPSQARCRGREDRCGYYCRRNRNWCKRSEGRSRSIQVN